MLKHKNAINTQCFATNLLIKYTTTEYRVKKGIEKKKQ